MSKEDQRRKFMISLKSERARQHIRQHIDARFPGSLIVLSGDGIETVHKIANDQPHVLIIEEDLPKRTGKEVVSAILKKRNLSTTAILFLSAIPEEEHFVDEVVVGRVQFLERITDEVAFSKAVTKALNYSSHGGKAEFYLRYLNTGDYLMRQGEKAEYVYILKSGRMHAQINKDGKVTVLGYVEPGEFVGEMAYINGEPRLCDVVALSECELIEIPIDHLDHLLFQKPSWGRALLKTLSKRVKIAAEKEAKYNS